MLGLLGRSLVVLALLTRRQLETLGGHVFVFDAVGLGVIVDIDDSKVSAQGQGTDYVAGPLSPHLPTKPSTGTYDRLPDIVHRWIGFVGYDVQRDVGEIGAKLRRFE